MTGQIAYFSAEFGLDESLPIYSGGLGVLAGDFVKAASDLQVPLTGVGILYRKGYFKQNILQDGTQEAVYTLMNPEELPIEAVVNSTGKPILVPVPIANRTVYLRIWRAFGGHVPVYLLDADIDANAEADRRLTDRLYGGNQETRIIHEIILGIGGVRALRALQINPEVWHLNEGHVAFAALERIREYSARKIPFDTALEIVKATTVFTTHTPVPAGHDVFSFDLVDQYLSHFYWQLGADREKVIDLGRTANGFNMTRLSVSVASIVNGVSRLHAEVTKQLFHDWMPQIPAADIPVFGITNGVHTRTWLAPEMSELLRNHLGEGFESHISGKEVWNSLFDVGNSALWQTHLAAKRRMIAELNLPIPETACVIGFARRFATYKRATLILQDLNRFLRIINHQDGPVYFVFAGKAHPSDLGGQELVRRIVQITKADLFQGKVFFIPDYNLGVAKRLVQGVDVWLNTPIRPMEASGTSGQKAALNGVLNCSILDGWWDEGYNGQNGFAIRDEGENADGDNCDAENLYRLLEEKIIPLYYRRIQGVPIDWVALMKNSMVSLIPEFSTNRMLKEYISRVYEPASMRGGEFTENGFEIARRVADYKRFIRSNWQAVRVNSVHAIGYKPSGAGSRGEVEVTVEVQLGPVWYRDVEVDIVCQDEKEGVLIKSVDYLGEIRPGIHLYMGKFQNVPENLSGNQVHARVLPVSRDFYTRFEMELATWG